jgi:hypothetical protein
VLSGRESDKEGCMADVTDLARRHDDTFNSQDADGRAAIEAPDIDFVMPGGMTLRGHEQVMQVVRAFWDALPGRQDHRGRSGGGRQRGRRGGNDHRLA